MSEQNSPMNSKEPSKYIKNTVIWQLGYLVFVTVMLFSVFVSNANAISIGSRYLLLSTSVAGANANHNFGLMLISAVPTGSISFEYCQESPLFDVACTAPVGINLSGVVLSAQTGEVGFSVHPSSTSSKIILTRAVSIVTPGPSTYTFSGVTNPSQSNTSSYVRVATYVSTDASGSRIDEGGLAFSITNPLNIQADIPPSLTLCTGIVVAVDCTSSSGLSIDFGDFSSGSTKTATSQFAIASNDDTGYKAYILGTSLTSGVNVIAPSTVQSVSTLGVSQFGINLAENTSPPAGSLPIGSGSGVVDTNYDDSNLFKYSDGDLIASSPVSTTFNRFTISYIVNISSNQTPGIYSTNLTVLGVANF
jgi:hypothetical protein